MSLYSIARLARQRDYGSPETLVGRPADKDAAKKPTPQTTLETLVMVIPSEALALYTAMLGLILAEVKSPEQYIGFRWVLLVSFLFAVPLYVFFSWRGAESKSRRAPWMEMASALIAFAAWGLAMPGSPMHATLTGAQDRMASGMIVLAAVAVLSFLQSPLRQAAKKRQE